MNHIYKWILFVLAFCCLQITISYARECRPENPSRRFNFTRIFIVKERATNYTDSEQAASAAAGSCTTVQQLRDKVATWFFDNYRLNIQHVRDGPFRRYETAAYIIKPVSAADSENDRVVAGTLMGHANYMNTKFYWTGWFLTAKSEITGRAGTIPAGYEIGVGLMRFRMNGQDVCLEAHDIAPRYPMQPGTLTYPYHISLFHEKWKQGYYRTVGTRINTNFQWDTLLTFSA